MRVAAFLATQQLGLSTIGMARKPPATLRQRGGQAGNIAATAPGGAAEAGPPAKAAGRARRILSAQLPTVLLATLVIHKAATDSLGRFTRNTGAEYSATSASILGEFIKVPVLLTAITFFEGPSRVLPILREARDVAPWNLCLPGLAWAVQNVLYFMALSHLSAASYQILSQTKLLFTGFFMSALLGKRLSMKQILSLGLLLAGSAATQVSEISRASLVGSGNALYGGFLAVLGAFLAALPNVYYEKILKSSEATSSFWAKNVQVTFWIAAWLSIGGVAKVFAEGGVGGLRALGNVSGVLDGVTFWVWSLITMQSLKCLIIPATLKYADNILYAFAKPAAILVTAAGTTMATGIVPTPVFCAGAVLCTVAMVMYEAK